MESGILLFLADIIYIVLVVILPVSLSFFVSYRRKKKYERLKQKEKDNNMNL